MTPNAKSYTQMRSEFYNNYTNKILPLVRKHENLRKEKLYNAIGLILIQLLVAYLLFFMGQINDGIMEHPYILLSSIGFCVSACLTWPSIKKEFENSIKRKIMPIVCSCFDDMCWMNGYYPGEGLFLRSCAVPEFTYSIYDDIFMGSYKDVNMEIIESEYHLRAPKTDLLVFDGVIVKLDMNKAFNSHTVVETNCSLKISPSKGLHRIKLEDVKFNKKFDVYTNDEVEARYLITPTFMERLKRMTTAFSAAGVRCAFYDKYLIIALFTCKDIFSICSLTKPMDDREQYFRMYEEISSIVKLIDHFKLDQKIGL